MSECRVLIVAALLLSGSAAPGPARADPGYYVVTAYDQAGVASADLRYWTVSRPGRPETIWPEVGLGYGVTSRWHTELVASYIGASNRPTTLSTLNWQNEFLLTQGELPVDLALHALLVRPKDRADGHALEWGPVLQTDIGRTQLNANLFFERVFGADEPVATQMKYQWQIRHRWMPGLHLGLQGFGELGPWDDWAERDAQSHRAGPALFGRWPVAGTEGVWLYQAAMLYGSVYRRPGRLFSMRVQYQF